MTYTDPVSERVKALYDTVSYATYGVDFSPVFKSLKMEEAELRDFFRDKNALEVGCGGGQITMHLARLCKTVTAVDISTKSLDKAREACHEAGLQNVSFMEKNLFDNEFLQEYAQKFDYVLCYGVLHHTQDPQAGFAHLTELVKPGGYVTVGLYSRTLLAYRIKRQLVLWLAGEDWDKRKAVAKRWFFPKHGSEVTLYDAYMHPQVSFHSVGQILDWVSKQNLTYVGSWPFVELGKYINWLFGRSLTGSGGWNYHTPMYWMVELLWMLAGKSVMINVSAKKI